MQDLDEAYRAYAPRLLAYCTALLRDRDAAADAVQDAFLTVAAKQHQLRDPARFEAWLYAVARNNCRAQQRVRGRQVAFDFDETPAGTLDDPAAAVRAAEVRELVHAAASGLGEADREIVELAIRHSLSPATLSVVLDLPVNHVHARLSRARGQLERAIGALLLARYGRADCPELAVLLDGWDGRLDPLTRKRISRHSESCERCATRRGVLASPASLLAGYASLPFVAVSAMDPARFLSAPPPRPRPRSGRRLVKVVVPVLAVALLGGALALAAGRDERVSSGSPSAFSIVSQASPSALPTPQPAVGSPGGPGVKVRESSTALPSPVAAFTVAVTDKAATCTTASNTYKLHVEIVTSAAFGSARLHWIEGSWPRRSLPIEATGPRSGEVTKVLLKDPAEWWVEAVAADGRTAKTARGFVRSPCL